MDHRDVLYWLFLLYVQFYDKFTIRHNIAELLEYLWQVPSHRNAWKQVGLLPGPVHVAISMVCVFN